MEIREARAGDRQAIRKLARRSLESSYSLGPRDIDSAVAEWYSDGRLDETLADEDSRLLVADDDGVVGFAEAVLTGSTTAQLLWLHVDPEHRGAGHGQRLFDATRERLRERGVDSLQGRVLAASQTGGAFYESQGLSKVGEEHTEIDGSRHVEYIYADLDEDGLEAVETDAGTRYVRPRHRRDGVDGTVSRRLQRPRPRERARLLVCAV